MRYRFNSKKSTQENEAKNMQENNFIELIPQFSNFNDGAYRVVEILSELGNPGVSFLEMGRYLQGSGKTDVAYLKYGENHSKLAELLDLVTITRDRPRKIFLTNLGKSLYNSSTLRKIEIIKSQVYRMEIVKDIIIKHTNDSFELTEYLLKYFKTSTVKRRKPNIKTLFKFLKEHGVDEVNSVLMKIN